MDPIPVTLNWGQLLVQLPVVGIVLLVVFFFVNRQWKRDDKQMENQSGRDKAFTEALDRNSTAIAKNSEVTAQLSNAVGHLDRSLRENGVKPK